MSIFFVELGEEVVVDVEDDKTVVLEEVGADVPTMLTTELELLVPVDEFN
jgi:hypothetical protein